MNSITRSPNRSVSEERLAAILDDYIEKLEKGKAPDRKQLLEQNPGIASELESCFASLDFIGIAGLETIGSKELIIDDSKPKQLGQFILVREIGRGGMGVVYEAEDTELERQVAIKVLPFASMLDEQRLKRFRLEAQAAASLHHPHIVPVHCTGYASGIHFYVMDLINGPSLDAVVSSLREAKGAESSGRTNGQKAGKDDTIAAITTEYSNNRNSYHHFVARLGVQAASGLECAHQSDIIHRDIKPSNLLLDADGNVIITDFGLARTATDLSMTTSNNVAGTLRYMSPEQAAGKRTTIDGRTDVYSLGATLYELLALKPAFDSDDHAELFIEVSTKEPKPLSRIDPQIPRDLETVIAKAMAKEPAQRYDNAQELADDLQSFLDSRPVRARRVSAISNASSWVQRNRGVAVLALTVTLLIAAFAIGSFAVAIKFRKDLQSERYTAYARDIRLCQHLIADGQYVEAERKLHEWVPDIPANDLRDWEWYYLWRCSHHSAIKRTIKHKLAAFDVTFVEGDRLAIARWADTIDVWEPDSPESSPGIRLNSQTTASFALATMDDARTLVAGDFGGKLTFWNVATQRNTEEIQFDLPNTESWIESISFSPNQRFVAVGTGNWFRGAVHVWDRQADRCVAKLGPYQGSGLARFLDQDTLAVVAQKQNHLQLWSTSDWQLTDEIDVQGTGVGAIALSPDATTLVLGVHEEHDSLVKGRIELWNVGLWDHPKRFFVHNEIIRAIEFSPDGRLIAASADDRYISILEQHSGNVRLIPSGQLGKKGGLAFSSDGRTLAASGNDGTVNVWNVDEMLSSQRSEISLAVDESPCAGIEFLSDDLVCLVDKAGAVSIRELPANNEVRRFDVVHESASMTQIAISADHRFLAVARGNWPRRDVTGRVEIHNLESKSVHSSYNIPNGIYYTRSAFSRDSRHLAVCGRDRVLIINVENREVEHELRVGHPRVKSTAFSPDGRLLACADLAGETHFFETERFSRIRSVRTDATLTDGIDFSPDGQTFATVGFDRCVKLFDTQSGRLLREFARCADPIGVVRYSPNGKRIVTGGLFGKIRLWDVRSGDELLTFDFYPAFYAKPRFSPDGRSLAVDGGPTVKVFQAADPERLSRLSVSELNDIVCQDVNVVEAD